MRALIQRAKAGDESARHELAIALWPRLLSMAKYYARVSGEDPDDLLGEAWCALFGALQQVDLRIGQPECFLVERARWRVLDYLKWLKRRREAEPDDEGLEAHGPDIAPGVVGTTMLADLVADLSDTQRRVLVGVLRGHTWREVASHLGCSGANVAYHVKQIRQKWETLCGDGRQADVDVG